MAEFRNIHTRIWKDSWFSELEPDAKLLFIYLFSNERASVCGMYELPMKYIVFETGLDHNRVMELFAEFERAKKAYYRDGVVWVVNLRKYNDSGNSSKVAIRIQKDLEIIPDCELKRAYYQYEKIPYPQTADTLSGVGERDGDGDGDRYRDGEETEAKPEAPTPASQFFISDEQAERIYTDVTGMMSIPSRIRGEGIRMICDIARNKGPNTPSYLKPFFTAWCSRKTRDKRPYNRLAIGWLEWAVSGEIPPENPSPPIQQPPDPETERLRAALASINKPL